MAKRRKQSRLPRMVIACPDRRELLEFLEAMRRVPSIVRDLESLVEKQKRRRRITPGAPAELTNGERAGES